MRKELLHLYGPLSIHSYGAAIVVGLALFIWRIKKHPQAARLKLTDRIDDLILIGIAAGVLGGRLLYVLTEPDSSCYFGDLASRSANTITSLNSASLGWSSKLGISALWFKDWFLNFISFWDGGFSLLGTIVAILFSLTYYLKKTGTPILPFLDLIAMHAPLLQSASRVGCFFAGCCYGAITQLPWGVVYTDPDSIAPLCVSLHPTQLYSALALFIIFLLLQSLQNILKKPGQLLAAYLLLVSLERFTTDFWRDDRTFINSDTLFAHALSTHQLLALFIFCGAGILLIWSSIRKNMTRE
jgi:phosphatidylglycerol:prolipoprotein diacylglycerol transferase